MSFDGYCPACNSEIPSEGYSTGNPVCSCGWTDPEPAERYQKKAQKTTIAVMVAAAIVVSLGFYHMANWGSFATRIPSIKLQQLTGTLSKDGYHELAEICIQLNKWDCAREAYIEMQQLTRDGDGLIMLARLQIKLKQLEAAKTTLGTYFRSGGRDGEAALHFAKLLEASGDTASAIKYYESSIELRPNILPIQATTGIVRLMMKQGRYEEAYDRILAFHASAENAKGYLNTELASLEAAVDHTKNPKKGKHLASR